MSKHIIPACMLALCVALPAKAERWEFEYRGFYDVDADRFNPDLVLRGEFYSYDWGSDGVIQGHELTSLVVDGFSYLNCQKDWGFYCSVDSFSYSLTGTLNFVLYERYSDEHMGGHSTATVAGDFMFAEVSSASGNTVWREYWRWTDQTVFSITPPPLPVPEPSTLAMLTAGGALLGLRGRRSTRA